MIKKEIADLLTEGLLKGYAGDSFSETPWRGPFKVESSEHVKIDPETEEVTGHYIDQFFADRTGGGQEIAQLDKTITTRLYAGGTIGLEELKLLGLTNKDVTGYLKRKITELGGQTRLDLPCLPKPDGDWQYSYEILGQLNSVPLTIGIEKINFKETMVFAHGIFLTTKE